MEDGARRRDGDGSEHRRPEGDGREGPEEDEVRQEERGEPDHQAIRARGPVPLSDHGPRRVVPMVGHVGPEQRAVRPVGPTMEPVAGQVREHGRPDEPQDRTEHRWTTPLGKVGGSTYFFLALCGLTPLFVW